MLKNHSPEGTHPLSDFKYRPDIDGLRAIAVLSVVLYHAAPKDIEGGFVGVDIFFVISGFLISSIIFSGLDNHSFSFLDFYSRRIKRIFPALIVVLAASYAFGWFALLDYEYAQLGKHIAGGAGFISNFVLLNEAGYFDNAADTKPLLHLWSLGVEEQFYIVWPLLLWCVSLRRFNVLAIVLVVAVGSFVLNVALIHSQSTQVFFSPQTRFWELAAGSLLAYLTLRLPGPWRSAKQRLGTFIDTVCFKKSSVINRSIQRDFVSIMGLLLIAFSIFGIEKDFYFPGWWATLPVAGTVILIAAGGQAWVNRNILSSRLLVWFGLISYPLYLWHWPLLSFARIIESQTPPAVVILAAVLTAIILAWLTYRFVEVPIRFGKRNGAKPLLLVVSMASLGVVGFTTYEMRGLDFRSVAKPEAVNSGEVGHDAYYSHLNANFFSCKTFRRGECYQSKKNEPIDLVLVGDSHALHLLIGLAEELKSINVAFYGKGAAIGDKGFDEIFDQILNSRETATVVMNYWWFTRRSEVSSDADLGNEIERKIRKLIDANKQVFLTNDIPSFEFDPEKCQISRKFSFSSYQCNEDIQVFRKKYDAYQQAIEGVGRKYPSVQIINTVKYFCDDSFCRMNKDDRLLYRDRHHLNLNGSRYTAKRILKDYPRIAATPSTHAVIRLGIPVVARSRISGAAG